MVNKFTQRYTLYDHPLVKRNPEPPTLEQLNCTHTWQYDKKDSFNMNHAICAGCGLEIWHPNCADELFPIRRARK